MSDRWRERLSDYLDGELDVPEQEALESHLRTCRECAGILEELRSVVSRARALEDRPPTEDLWPGIAAAIGVAHERSPDVLDLGAGRRRAGWRRFSFSLPELAAASLALMLAGGGAVWLVRSGGEGPFVAVAPSTRGPSEPSSGTPPRVSPSLATNASMPAGNVPVASFAEEQYGAAVADLEGALAAGRDRLDPATVRVLEENLRIVDRAIQQARVALAADPGSIYLNDHLAESMRRKLELLRRANAIVSAQA